MSRMVIAAGFLLASGAAFAANTSAAASLVEAARADDAVAAVSALQAGADVNQVMVDGSTSLHWAVYNGNEQLVAELIRAGAEVNVVNRYGSSPMSEAGVIGHAGIIRLLLQAGADPESPTLEGQTTLMSVVRTPHTDAAELLINAGADVNAFETWRGQTTLMFAAAQSQPQQVRLLLEHGADPDTISVVEDWPRQVTNEPRPQNRPLGGFTALLLAAREGCAECAHYLIEGGADIDLPDPYMVTPLTMAALNARWDTARVLIEGDADVNRWDYWGRAPLYSTVDYNTVPRGGRPDRPSGDATTPVQIARMLLERGANPDMQLKLFPPYRSLGNDRGGDSMLSYGTTPLIRAAKAGDVEMVSLLLEFGADPGLRNWGGHSPITAVSGLGSSNLDLRGRFRDEHNGIATARLLLAAGADINRKDAQGRRPVHGAATWGWNDFIRFAVEEAGADINAEDDRGLTALDVAMGRGGGIGRAAVSTQADEDTIATLLALGARGGSAAEVAPMPVPFSR